MRPSACLFAALLAAGVVSATPVPPVGGPHAGLDCAACHTSQPPTAEAVGCTAGGCHGEHAGVFATSRHDREYLKDQRPACPLCHGGHQLLTGRRALVAACGGPAEKTCWECHPRERYGLPRIALAGVAKEPGDELGGIHEKIKRRLGCSAATISCFTCHGVHHVLPLQDPDSPVSRQKVAATCGSCHVPELEGYQASIHAKGLAQGLDVAPTCTSCHGAHGVKEAKEHNSPTGAERVVNTCADCHEDPAVTESALLATDVVNSYEESFHGIAYRHGLHDVATCVSCHGAHRVLAIDDPASPVSPQKIRATCSACHEEVTAKMIAAVRHPGGQPGPRGLIGRLKVYFPVAGTAVNPLVISGLGALVGFLSGVFGVGGGFLMTPLLIFIGIPAAGGGGHNDAASNNRGGL